MVAVLLLVTCLLVIGAAALMPLRRPVFMAVLLLPLLGYAAHRAARSPTVAAVDPLSGFSAFLVLLLIRYLAEQRRQARRLLVAERATAEAQATAATEGERARIARDLHDGLTHQLTALLLHVQTAQALLADGATLLAADRMTASVAHARGCLNEARDVVDVLRAGSADPQALVKVAADWASATGRRVTVSLPQEAVHLDGPHWGAAMAVLRESLTNVARHSSSRAVTVELCASAGEMQLTVRDDEPDPDVVCTPGRGGGFGLVGLAERASLLNGTVVAGPLDGGWQTVLRLPFDHLVPNAAADHLVLSGGNE